MADPTNSEPQRARQDEFEFSTSVTGLRSARATLPANAGRALMQLSDGSRPLGNTPLMVPDDFHGDRVKKIAPDKIPRVVAITDDAGSVLQVAGAIATESGGALTLEINTSIAPKRRQYVVRGKVVESAGKPLSGATVALGLRNRRTTCTTAADGSYEITGSEPRIGGSPPIGQTLLLTAVKPGFAVASAPALEVPSGDTIEVEPLRLVASGVLKLRVIDALGEPAAGAWVHLGEFGFARTDTEGRLIDRTVAPGETSLRIQLGPLKYAGKVAVSADDAGAEQTITLR